MILANYATIVFDCDGVILDSNPIKKDAFRQAVLEWGEEPADALVAYHVGNGGVSRYAKFAYFRKVILPSFGIDPGSADEQTMLAAYAGHVRERLFSATAADQLHALRHETQNAKWLVVSGGDQHEVRDVLSARGLDVLFDGGIFGSPDEKSLILEREKSCGNILSPAVYLGDSTYDYECARGAGLDFVFVSGWTEVANWQDFVARHQLPQTRSIAELIDHRSSVNQKSFKAYRTS